MPRRLKGEGSIRERSDGTFEFRIKIDGKSKSFYGKTPTETRKKKDNYLQQKENKITEFDNITFDDFILKWLREVKKNELKPSSYDRLESTIVNKIIPTIGFYKLDELDEEVLQIELINHYAQTEKSYSSIKKIYDATNACLSWASGKRKIKYNPMNGVSKVTSKNYSKKEIKIISEAEIEKIQVEINRTYKTKKSVYSNGHGLLLMLYTGIREGELLGLKWSDYDEKHKILRINRNVVSIKNRNEKITKNYVTIVQDNLKTSSSKRVLVLSEDAITSIQSIKSIRGKVDFNDFIICSQSGQPWNANYLQKLFDSVLTNAGVEHYNLHSLRHTYASNLFKNGIDIKIISALLGHSSVKITYDTYIHIVQTIEAKVIQNKMP